ALCLLAWNKPRVDMDDDVPFESLSAMASRKSDLTMSPCEEIVKCLPQLSGRFDFSAFDHRNKAVGAICNAADLVFFLVGDCERDFFLTPLVDKAEAILSGNVVQRHDFARKRDQVLTNVSAKHVTANSLLDEAECRAQERRVVAAQDGDFRIGTVLEFLDCFPRP